MFPGPASDESGSFFPKQFHFERPNRVIDLQRTPLRLAVDGAYWPRLGVEPGGRGDVHVTTPPQTEWQVPEPLSTHDVRVDDDTVITLRRHGNPAGPRLVLSHGNGLAIDLYNPFWSLLADDFDLIVHDLRNHGWNPLGPLARSHASHPGSRPRQGS